jgi:hypothetical protein
MDGVSRDAHVAGAGKPAGIQRGVDLANAGHALAYVHDGESDHITNLVPDVGDPYRYDLARERYTREQTWVREGMMQHAQYFGLGTVDAFPPFMRYGGVDDETYVAPHDNSATAHDESTQQPASVLFHEYRNLNDFDYPSPDVDSDQFIYDSVANGGYSAENTEPQMNTQIVAYGPYTLAPGEKAKVVVAYVAGMASDAAKYDNYKTYAQPFQMGFNNLYGGLGNAPVKFSDRQSDIPFRCIIGVMTFPINHPPSRLHMTPICKVKRKSVGVCLAKILLIQIIQVQKLKTCVVIAFTVPIQNITVNGNM